MTRGALLGSAAAHVALLAVIFAVRQGEPLIVPGPDVVQVALLDPGGMPRVVPVPNPPSPRAEMKAPDIQPEHAEGVKLAPPKKAPEKAPPPTEEAAPPLPGGTSLPYARVGSAGLTGGISADARDFEFTYYLMLIRNKIAQNWSPPTGLAAGRPVRAVIYFHVSRNGDVSNIRLEQPSGVSFFDQVSVRAVSLSDPLPPLPLGFPGSDLGIHFGFEYAHP